MVDVTGVVISLAMLASAVAIAVGLLRYRPVRPWPWWLLAGSLVIEAVGAAIFEARSTPSASPYDWSAPLGETFLIGTALGLVALRQLLFRGMPRHDREAVVDAAIVAVVVGLVIWVVVTTRGSVLADMSLSGGVVLLLQVAVFGAVLRMAFSGLLAIGAFRWMVAMIILLQVGAVWTLVSGGEPQWAQRAVWSAALLCPGMAALSGSMRNLSASGRSVGADGTTPGRMRAVLLCAAVVAVPLSVVLERNVTGRHQVVVWVGLLAMSVAVAGRMIGMVRQRDALAAELNRANVELEHLAAEDVLTRLPNRRYFQQVLDDVVTAHQHDRKSVAVLVIDLDRFKAVNDNIGHAAGDQLLVAVARRLESAVRGGDTPARVGGDEFGVVCPDVADEAAAREIAERVTQALNGVYKLDGHRHQMTASVGVAVAAGPRMTAAGLLRRADVAMYQAKRRGRARVEHYNRSVDDHSVRHLELAGALERGEFVVFYQPEIDLRSGAILWAEALVRWRHPVHGLLPPDEFLDVAEETGAIIPMGHWLLRQACEQLAWWWEHHPQRAPVTMAVNVSSSQLADPQLIGTIREALAGTRLDPQRLWLEITETSVIQQPRLIAMTLAELKSLGVGLALDDFGTGYSSLAHVKQFPLDALKIDRTFIAGMTRDPQDRMIVSAVVSLAHAFGLLAIAEGVETAEQLAELRHLRCDFAQGYLWSRPLEADAFTAWMNDRRVFDGDLHQPHAASDLNIDP